MNLVNLAIAFAEAWIESTPDCDPMVSRASLKQGLAHLRRSHANLYDEFLLLGNEDRRRVLLFISMALKLT